MEIAYPHCLFDVLGQEFRSFSLLKERYRSVLYVPEGQNFEVCSAALRSVCCLKLRAVLKPTFSCLRRRLSTLVRLTVDALAVAGLAHL